jgi:RNA polymerase-binding transcription factor DksA
MGSITSDRRHERDPLERDFAEQATQREGDEVLDALDESGRRELAQVRAALARMEAGSYGECVVCGEEIPPARLRAVPTATTCVACAP